MGARVKDAAKLEEVARVILARGTGVKLGPFRKIVKAYARTGREVRRQCQDGRAKAAGGGEQCMVN